VVVCGLSAGAIIVQTLTVPTLCVVDDVDGSTPLAVVAELADLISGAWLVIIAGCGSLVGVEQPEPAAEAMLGSFEEKDLG
jgi:3-oxoadipate enol-lactonase